MTTRRRLLQVAPLALALPLLPGRAVAAGTRIAVFDFALIDTSLNPDSDAQQQRLRMVTGTARDALRNAGYELVDTGSVPAETQQGLRSCNGCELDIARQLGAEQAALGWVQKVSVLILNINLQIREVGSGRLLKHGSVDIRGDTDESWGHGIKYLMKNRILAT